MAPKTLRKAVVLELRSDPSYEWLSKLWSLFGVPIIHGRLSVFLGSFYSTAPII